MIYGFDRHPFLKHSTAEPQPQQPSANEMREALSKVCKHVSLLDNQQLAALFTACEVEHVNRMAALAGYMETA